jgi:hypothetical protein
MEDADDWDQPFSDSDSDLSGLDEDESDNGEYGSEEESSFSVIGATPINAAEARMLQKRNGEEIPHSQSYH